MKIKVLLIFSILSVLLSPTISAQLIDREAQDVTGKKFDSQIKHFQLKSKKQKNLAWILLGSSVVISAVSSSTDGYGNVNNNEALAVIANVASIASIPMFFSASNNKNKAQLIRFQKEIAFASSDSMKKYYTQDAAEYFLGKASGNTTAAVILSAVGGALIVAGISHNTRNDYFTDDIIKVLYTAAGITIGGLSIPFYVRASNLRRTANVILRTGRIPRTDVSSISPVVNVGQYVAVGIRVHL